MIWLASYPRSGNSWLRFVVANLWSGADSIKPIGDAVCDQHTYGYDFCKTHAPTPAKETRLRELDDAIYIYRNPIDVCASLWEYCRLKGKDRSPAEMVKRFCAGRYGRHGRWDDHVTGWDADMGSRSRWHIVRYESVCDPDAKGGVVLAISNRIRLRTGRILGPPERAIAFASADNMRRMEREAIHKKQPGFFYDPRRKKQYRHGGTLLPACRANRAEGILSVDDKRRIVDAYGDTMVALGYGVDI